MSIPGSNLFRRARSYLTTYGVRAFLREVTARGRARIAGDDAPNRFHVEISNCCNFDCEYCVLREQATGDKVMSAETFEQVLPFLKNASSVALSGLAEPLMNRHFTAFLRSVREVAPHAVIGVDTNASLLTEEISEALVEARLDSLVFSLDGVDPALVDGIRHGGSLSGLLDNVRTLAAVKGRHGSDLPVVAATVVLQRKNLHELPGIVRLASELGVKLINVNGLEPYDAALTAEALWTGGDTGELVASVTQAGRLAEELGILLRFPSPVPQEPRCPQMGRPVILADGTVVPCSVLAYHREGHLSIGPAGEVLPHDSTTDRVTFGNVNDTPLDEIWAAAEYKEFRSRVARRDFPDACSACLMKHNVICAGPPLTAREFVAALESPRSR